MDTEEGLPIFITRAQAARMLQVSNYTIDRLIREGLLVAFKIDNSPTGSVRITFSSINDLVTKRKVGGPTPT